MCVENAIIEDTETDETVHAETLHRFHILWHERQEYFSKLNSLKLERRNKEKTISEIESRVTSMEQFSLRASSSEFQFVKNLTP